MRGIQLCFCLAVITLFPAVALAVDSTVESVNAHLNAIAWFSGTFHCTGQTAYSNGKVVRTKSSTVIISKPQNGWMQAALRGQPGSTSFGYDPKKDRYVFLSTAGPGAYAAGYFAIASDRSIAMEFPDLMDNDVYSAGDFQRYTPTSKGYDATATGPSDTYPGVRYKATFACVRQ
jgi:hypothetical protein